MPTLSNGLFTFEIPTEDLARGLRTTARNPRNVKFLTSCSGAVGIDNVLQVLEDIDRNRIDTSVITDGFPYPQLFVFTRVIVVCGRTRIYELTGGSLELALDVGTGNAGSLWSAVDFYEYIYMSNDKVAVRRSATSRSWEITSDLPAASAICNFNGQVMIGVSDIGRLNG